MKRAIATVVLLALTILTTGCQPDPAKARDSVAAAFGFIGDLQTKHLTECQANKTLPVCVEINKAVAVQRLAASSLNAYCAGPPTPGAMPYMNGGPCSVQSGLESRLTAALQDLNNVMVDLKKLGGN
jgi:hypothetical protein